MPENTNKATDLNELLFETLKGVKSGDIDIAKAKTISELSGRIIDLAKAETEFVRISKQQRGSAFFPAVPAPAEERPSGDGTRQIGTGTVSRHGAVTTHRMGDR